MNEAHADVVIVGGSVGGCAAALAAARMGRTVILTEETDWIGGQLTNQAVPPDENQWIEKFGGTWLYHEFRARIRDYYRRNYPLSSRAIASRYLNPGNGYVSRLCHEPRVALAVLYEMLAPHLHSGRLRLLLKHRAISAEVRDDRVCGISVVDEETGRRCVLVGKMFVDATELGDLLPLTGTEYVTGAESQDETNELHAPTGPAQPLNMQAITFCFAIDYVPGADYTIEKPEMYDFWRDYVPDVAPAWPGKLLSWVHPVPTTLEPRTRTLFDTEAGGSLWRYRRLIDKDNFIDGTFESDISLVNWPQNDYFLGPICEVAPDEVERHLMQAKQLSLSLLYWMQTEAPRPDGGVGYPGLRLRPDVVGTQDGLAKYPYIRESRRIRAQFTVREEHVGLEMRGGRKAARFEDSVGIGHYNIDLHPSTGGDNYIDVPSAPFQIPLGSLLPIRMRNLLPACKNIGVTHITNGCYRLHPVEWNIGESVGYLAAYCLERGVDPEAVRTESHLGDFQRLLEGQGVELSWPNIGE
ncbi:MAG: FAD-dependent oxidoreductase [Alicyclobacillus sp.]|nr:FAD-dependent oxidoreductase [Alicyclobacillus sp.]